MVPLKSHPRWAALLRGKIEHRFSSAAASMLLFRLKADLRTDGSPAAEAKAIDELHAFFSKYGRILQPDIKAIFN